MSERPQPVYIFGYTHSGTSLLQGIFRLHPDVYSQRSESSFYQFPYHYIHNYPTLDSDAALNGMISFCANLIITGHRRLFDVRTEAIDSDILSPDELAEVRSSLPENPPHRLVFPATFDFLARRDGKRIWVEKTPDHTQQAARILEEIPHALAIEIVREPRDILSSKKLREQRMVARLKDGTATIDDQASVGVIEYDPFWNSLAWRSAIRAMNKAHATASDRILTLRYEDLTADPQRVVQKVCEFVGIEFTPKMLETERSNIAGRDKMERDTEKGIVSSSVGRWHTTLSSGEKALATRLLFRELRQHGYPVEPLSTHDSVASVFTAIVSVPKLGVRLAAKLRAKGWRHTANSIQNYVQRLFS